MSATVKYAGWIAGGALFGGVARFFLSGDYTRRNMVRHVGYVMVGALGGVIVTTLHGVSAGASELGQAAITGAIVVVAGRAADLVLFGRVKADLPGGVHIEDGGKDG